jgi:hypothetical protein
MSTPTTAQPKPDSVPSTDAATVAPKAMTGGHVQAKDKARDLLLQYEGEGLKLANGKVLKGKLDEGLPDAAVVHIAAACKCSKATVFLARKELIKARTTPTPSPAGIEIKVAPQPKPAPQAPTPLNPTPGQPADLTQTKPLDLDFKTLLGVINPLLVEFKIEPLSDAEIGLLATLWDLAMSNVRVRQEIQPTIVSSQTIMIVALVATVGMIAARALKARAFLKPAKPAQPEAPKPAPGAA